MKIQLTHTYDDIISVSNLLHAWEEFATGKSEKPDVMFFAQMLMDNIFSLHDDLVNRTYQHGGYESFFINDPKRRHIHKASVRDRLLHQAVYRILYPFFDRTFIADSYSCRVDKGVHRAINRFREFAFKVSRNHTRTCWILKCDIKQFFASVDQGILMQILVRYIPDYDILDLLTNILDSFHTPQSPTNNHSSFVIPTEARRRSGGIFPSAGDAFLVRDKENSSIPLRFSRNDKNGYSNVGLPLGNLTSQLLTNIYLNQFDQWVKHTLKVKYYIRYADDFVFLSNDREDLLKIIPEVRNFLADRLALALHPKKIYLGTVSAGMDFLGWVHFSDHRVLRTTTKYRMFRRIREHPTDETVQSYLGFLSHGNAVQLREKILVQQWLWQS